MVYLTAEQLSEKLGVSSKSIHSLAKKGDIPYYIIGRRLRFVEEEVDAHLRTSKRIMSNKEARQIAYGRHNA
jgi:excisionase family DNA binding protein